MNYCCYTVTEEIFNFLHNKRDYTLVRLVPSIHERNIECPIFNLAECYYRDLVILDDKVENFIKTFPGKKSYEKLE